MKRLLSVFTTLCLVIFEVNGICDIVPKKNWHGMEATHVENLHQPVDLVIIQHTVSQTCFSDESCGAVLRGIQDFHMGVLGFWDIGPSLLVGGNGKVYEGAGWTHVGAHTHKYNKKSIGISFIGNFNKEWPTEKSMAAAKAVIECGVEKGIISPDYKLVGHRQLITTESPGFHLYDQIIKWSHWQKNVHNIKDE